MNHEQIQQVAALFDAAPTVTEIEVRNNGVSLRLRRVKPSAGPKVKTPAAAPALASPLPTAAVSASNTGAAAEDAAPVSGGELVTAHMVGIFRAARTGKTDADRAPLSAGATVTEGQTLGSVETMRILNECSAPDSGVIAHVFVSDGQPVEYGQALFEIVSIAANAESFTS